MVAARTGRRVPVSLAMALLLVGAGDALALTDEEIFREFRFNFLNPGARSLGMGGAFVALADDATAAQANPAGLHYVSGPQLFVEYRSLDEDPRRFDANLGSLEVDPLTAERDLPFLELTSGSATEEVNEPAFVSFVWPFRGVGQRISLAASRHVLLSREQSLTTGSNSTRARFSFDSFPNTVAPGGGVEAYSIDTPVSGFSDTEIVYWNVGASVEIHEDFSVGVLLSLAELDFSADTLTTVSDPIGLFLDPGNPRLPATPTSDLFRSTIDDTDTDFAYALGVNWHPDSVFASGPSPWRFGAVFRRGARFEVDQVTTINGVPDLSLDTRLAVPDRYSVGAMYRPRPEWTVSMEIERIEYSDMLVGFTSGVNYLTSGRVADGAFGTDPDATIEYDVDDATVPRAGVEYSRPFGADPDGERRFSIRAGLFRMPDSRIRMVSFNSDDPEINDVYLEAFRGADDETHFTVGGGVSLGRSSFQLAGDFSDEGTQIVGSYVLELGKTK